MDLAFPVCFEVKLKSYSLINMTSSKCSYWYKFSVDSIFLVNYVLHCIFAVVDVSVLHHKFAVVGIFQIFFSLSVNIQLLVYFSRIKQ